MTNISTPLPIGEGQGARLEVCAASIESIKAAYMGGAQRVELCSALSLDGLTPSAGMITYAKMMQGLKVHVLIRPREGNFIYTPDEVLCMVSDIKICRALQADGVVIGVLTPDGDIDVAVCRQLVEAAEGMSITFHRAFDVCRNPQQALEDIIVLGCHRLLTSGQAKTAEEGAPLIKALVEQAAGRIIIMPGVGVNPQNARHILDATGATEIHASAREGNDTSPLIVQQIITTIKRCILHAAHYALCIMHYRFALAYGS